MTTCSISSKEINEWVWQAKTVGEVNARIKFLKKEILPLLIKLSNKLENVVVAQGMGIHLKSLRKYTEPVKKAWARRPITYLSIPESNSRGL